jgi:uroporphyrinogen-III decarboxylase
LRPLLNSETDAQVELTQDNTEIVFDKKRFQFNSVFRPTSTQGNLTPCCLGNGPLAEVFDEIKPIIQSVMDGYNACIFAYGE